MSEAPRSQFPLHATARGGLWRVPQRGICPLSLCLSIVLHVQDVHFYFHYFSWPGRF